MTHPRFHHPSYTATAAAAGVQSFTEARADARRLELRRRFVAVQLREERGLRIAEKAAFLSVAS